MKISDMTPERQLEVEKGIEDLNEIFKHELRETGGQVLRYLFLVNGGGAIAVVSFMGASEVARKMPLTTICFKLFLLGVLLSGGTALNNYFCTLLMSRNWRKRIDAFYKNELQSRQMFANLVIGKAKFLNILGYIFGLGSFVCFAIGVIIILNAPLAILLTTKPQ